MAQKGSVNNQRRPSFLRRTIAFMAGVAGMVQSLGGSKKGKGKSGLITIDTPALTKSMPPDSFGRGYRPNQRKIRKRLKQNSHLSRSKKYAEY